MTTELIINIYHFAIIGGIVIILAIVAFLLHNFGGVKLFIDKDKEITNKFLDKFPLVSPDFINKSAKEQNVENNQEIHELNKKVELQNENIDKLIKIVEELSKLG